MNFCLQIIVLFATINASTSDGGASNPNVLLVIVDDLKPSLGIYGDEAAFTPHMDAIAGHGVVFKHVFAQQAVCGPSRTSFLTSRRPDRTWLYDFRSYWRNHANFTTLPQYFRENGYITTSIGKVFHPGKASNHSDDQPYSWTLPPYHPPTQKYANAAVCLGVDGLLHKNLVCPVLGSEANQPGGSLPDIQIADQAVQFLHTWRRSISNGSETRPFLLAVGFHKPHVPLKFPAKYLSMHPLANIKLANNSDQPIGMPTVAWNPWSDIRKREDIATSQPSWPWGPMPPAMARLVKQGYYAATSYVDDQIGRVLRAVPSNTIIVITSDHGWSLGEHGEWAKYSVFDEATRVPLIIVPQSPKPGEALFSERLNGGNQRQGPTCHNDIHAQCAVGAARYVDGLYELVDLFPSLVDLAGLPTIQPCSRRSLVEKVCTEGKSFAELLLPRSAFEDARLGDDDREHEEDQAFSQYPRPSLYPQINSDLPHSEDIQYMGYSLRKQEYRCAMWIAFTSRPSPSPDWSQVVAKELYLLDSDPNETINVSGRPEYDYIMDSCYNSLRNYTDFYVKYV